MGRNAHTMPRGSPVIATHQHVAHGDWCLDCGQTHECDAYILLAGIRAAGVGDAVNEAIAALVASGALKGRR